MYRTAYAPCEPCLYGTVPYWYKLPGFRTGGASLHSERAVTVQ